MWFFTSCRLAFWHGSALCTLESVCDVGLFIRFYLQKWICRAIFILHRVSLSLLPTTLPSIISHSHELFDVVGHPFSSSNEYFLGGSPNKKFVELKIRQITGAYIAYTMLAATHQFGRLHFPHTHAWCRYSSIVWPDLVKLLCLGNVLFFVSIKNEVLITT